ncbi:MAG: hypothetical protein OHK0017_05620 [Patescibacteria group bacterium]
MTRIKGDPRPENNPILNETGPFLEFIQSELENTESGDFFCYDQKLEITRQEVKTFMAELCRQLKCRELSKLSGAIQNRRPSLNKILGKNHKYETLFNLFLRYAGQRGYPVLVQAEPPKVDESELKRIQIKLDELDSENYPNTYLLLNLLQFKAANGKTGFQFINSNEVKDAYDIDDLTILDILTYSSEELHAKPIPYLMLSDIVFEYTYPDLLPKITKELVRSLSKIPKIITNLYSLLDNTGYNNLSEHFQKYFTIVDDQTQEIAINTTTLNFALAQLLVAETDPTSINLEIDIFEAVKLWVNTTWNQNAVSYLLSADTDEGLASSITKILRKEFNLTKNRLTTKFTQSLMVKK